MKTTSIGYYFIITASIVIIMYGLNEAAHLIVPFLLSLFLSIILLPFYSFFNNRGIPKIISLFIIIAILLLIVFFMTKLLSINIQQFNQNLPEYTKILSSKYESFHQYALGYGIEIPSTQLESIINTKNIIIFCYEDYRKLELYFY